MQCKREKSCFQDPKPPKRSSLRRLSINMAREKPTGPRHDLNKENEETLTTEPRVDPVLDAARQVAKKQKNDPHHHGHSPYKRDCLLPTKAAAWAFIAAFQAVMAGLSLPMHVTGASLHSCPLRRCPACRVASLAELASQSRTGYFLPTVIETILLWVTCGLFLIAGILSTVSFFSVMEVAIANDYRAERHDATPAKGEKKLAVVHSIIPVSLIKHHRRQLGQVRLILLPAACDGASSRSVPRSLLLCTLSQ